MFPVKGSKKKMQQRALDGLLQGLLDPRFQGLISEFYSLRSRLTVSDSGKLLPSIQHMLRTICSILSDQNTIQEMQQAAGNDVVFSLPDVNLSEVVECIEGLEELIGGPAFRFGFLSPTLKQSRPL